MWSTALRSSLSSKSLAASICITYANRATVYYTIGIYLVGVMTGTKGDDAEARSGSPPLRFAFLLSFFSSTLSRRLTTCARNTFVLERTRVHTLVYDSSRSDEANEYRDVESRGTSGRNVTTGKLDWFIGGSSIRADFDISIPGRNGSRHRESTLADTQKSDPRMLRASDPVNAEKKLSDFPSLPDRVFRSHTRHRVNPQPN